MGMEACNQCAVRFRSQSTTSGTTDSSVFPGCVRGRLREPTLSRCVRKCTGGRLRNPATLGDLPSAILLMRGHLGLTGRPRTRNELAGARSHGQGHPHVALLPRSSRRTPSAGRWKRMLPASFAGLARDRHRRAAELVAGAACDVSPRSSTPRPHASSPPSSPSVLFQTLDAGEEVAVLAAIRAGRLSGGARRRHG